MPDKMMNTKEVAEYLDIHEKQVYALIKAKKIPCTRVTGKWLFPKDLIDEWIKNNSDKTDKKSKKDDANHVGRALLAAGSNDPVLDVLFTAMKHKYPTLHVYTSSTGSTDGLHQLKNGMVDIAWCHLLDPNTGDYNVPYVASQFDDSKIAIVHLFYR